MNSVQLTGRLTRDPEVRYTDGGLSIARFTLAVNRRFKQENGPDADFIRCIAFGKTAEFIGKYFSKGRKMDLNGRIQTGSYQNQDGATVYTTEIIVENVEFGESRSAAGNGPNNGNQMPAPGDDGFMNIPDGLDEELPFS
ncbi:MAG: single-stranded DNA-binding protein [Frisingicoccus sp.]|uniref:single-stranded DNA-binding protein n=1 Tax=Frisingicoccus sp. TaxID=1918627 RepID=UPI002A82BFAB|nr:single-stranded DNA-binding protein [Frisingicoccus sp.]MDY4833946.1 single-stranded DNA-binding protein [Frisingicoccus sp.]